MLSSFMNKRHKKISLFNAVTLRRVQSPPSPQSFASPGRPSDVQAKKHSAPSKSSLDTSSSLKIASYKETPRVHLNLHNENSDSDWSRDILIRTFDSDTLYQGREDDVELLDTIDDDIVVIEPEANKSPIISSSLRETSPSSFSDSDASSKDKSLPHSASPRRPTPAPIKIPANHSKFRIARSSSFGRKKPISIQPPSAASRPESFVSDDASAVSGTTLARALIADTYTFVLSNDNPRPKHRSGGITRQDSATLPKGDYFYSPYGRDKRGSSGDMIISPESGNTSPVPPVPPLPPNLGDFVNPATRPNSLHNQKWSGSAAGSTLRHNSDEFRPSKPMPTRREWPSAIRKPKTETTRPAALNISLSESPQETAFSLPNHVAIDITPSTPEALDPAPISKDSARPSVSPRGSSDIDLVLNKLSSPLSSRISNHSPSPIDSSPQLSYSTDSLKLTPNSVTTPKFGTPDRGKRTQISRNSYVRPHLLPIGERPRSVHVPQSPQSSRKSEDVSRSNSHRQSSASRLGSPDFLDYMFLPQSAIAGRPDPIRVIRESLYDAADSSGRIPSTSDIQQTFPETPQTFSPLWSAASAVPKSSGASTDLKSSFRATRGGKIFLPAPKRTASLSPLSTRRTNPSKAEMMSPIPSSPVIPSPQHSGENVSSGTDVPAASAELSPTLGSFNQGSTHNNSSTAASSITSEPGSSPIKLVETITSIAQNNSIPTSGSAESKSFRMSIISNTPTFYSDKSAENASVTSLAVSTTSAPAQRKQAKVKPLPKPRPSPIDVPQHGPQPTTSDDSAIVRQSLENPPQHSPLHGSSQLPQSLPLTPQLPEGPRPPPSPRVLRVPQSQLLQHPPPLQTSQPPGTQADAPLQVHAIQFTHSLDQTLPASTLPVPSPTHRDDVYDLLRQSFESNPGGESVHPPPPYQTAIQTQPPAAPTNVPIYEHRRPSDTRQLAPQASTSTLQSTELQISVAPDQPHLNKKVSGRGRPPLPAGPRNPAAAGSRTTNITIPRSRNASEASIFLTPFLHKDDSSSSRKSSLRNAGQRLPKFQTTPVRWRGTPIDVAKWTFTSKELQNVVSRAIKQSAEASSIRLLKLQAIDHEVPEEMRRLENQATDIKAKYKILILRRRALLTSLTAHADEGRVMNASPLSQTVEELSVVSDNIEQLAEDLHNVNDQIAQLRKLCDIHSRSALSVALRKLNASFLRQATEIQILRDRLVMVEADRDDGWDEAQNAAQEVDDLTDRIQHQSHPSISPTARSSRRASRISAVRKSNIRLSKVSLRTSALHMRSPSRQVSLSRSTTSVEGHRVLRLPNRRRPTFTQTDDQQPLSSGGGIGTDMVSDAEDRALLQAQVQLCQMLGIDLEEFIGKPERRLSLCSPIPSPITPLRRQHSDMAISTRSRDSYFDTTVSDRENMLAALGVIE